MSNFLKQSTAVVVSFGPFLDKTDGVTEETGLVSALDHATTGIKLSKNGGALTIRHATVTATTYDAYGMYRVTLDTTDTNTLGTLRMAFNEAATCLPVWQDFMVLPANVYDSLVGGSDYLDVSAVQLAGQTITAAAGVTFPSSVASPTNITAATGITVSTNNDKTGYSLTATTGLGNQTANITGTVSTVTTLTNLPAATTDWLTAAAVKADAVTKIQNGLATPTNITAGTITTVTNLTNLPAAAALEATLTAMKGATFNGATDSLEALRDRGDAAWTTATGFSTLDAADVRTAVGLATANLDTQLGDLPTANENADALLDRAAGVETGLTPRQALRLTTAALAGKISGAETTTVVIRNTADTKDRITATVDTDGNRTAITTDLT